VKECLIPVSVSLSLASIFSFGQIVRLSSRDTFTIISPTSTLISCISRRKRKKRVKTWVWSLFSRKEILLIFVVKP
jgi:hypothetical protein